MMLSKTSFVFRCLYITTVICLPYSVLSVRGCVTYVAGEDYSMRQSICDKPDTHFSIIPVALPSQVVKLTVNHQDITELNASQFKHLPNLTYLDLDSNKIVRIHPNTFHVLKFLKTLSLRFNLLTFSSDSFHPNVVHGLMRLEYLNLLQNPIGYVPKRAFSPIGSSLRSLILSGGSKDFQLDPGALDGLTMLQLLDLSYNHLETLPETFESTLNNMQLNELYLHGNPWRCDCNLRWLKVWFLKYNSKLTYSRPIPEGMNRNVHDPSAQRWYDLNYEVAGDVPSLLQPRCASPYALFGRPLFSHQTHAGLQPVRTTDFHCLPQALTANQQVQFTLGSNSTLICEFFADPTGIVVWYRNGTLIQQRWSRVAMHQTTGRTFQAQLTVYGVQHSDAGTYVCFLDTGHGRVNSTFAVHVDNDEEIVASRNKVGMFHWINRLNTTLVLKYTGIIASCLIMLIMIIGLFIYCFYGRRNRSTKSHTDQDCSKHQTASTPDLPSPIVKHNTNGTYDYLSPRTTTTPQSSLVHKDKLLTELKENIAERQLVTSSGEKVENYVTFRILPSTNSKEVLEQRCPLQNYAIIHPVDPDSVLLDGADPRLISLPSSAQILVSPNQFSNPGASSDQSQLLIFKNSQKPITDLERSTLMHNSVHNVISDTNLTNASEITPCPLHGNVYATLNPQIRDRRDKVENSKRHIATMPAGLGSVHEKRTSTLPNRKKLFNSCETTQGQSHNSVGTTEMNVMSTPDITVTNQQPSNGKSDNHNTIHR